MVCGKIIKSKGCLCSDCFHNIKFITEPYCHHCGRPLNGDKDDIEGLCCISCLTKRTNFHLCRSAVEYDDFSKRFTCVKIDPKTNYLCDRLLVTYSTYFYPRNIICIDKNYLFIHGNPSDYKNSRHYKDDIYSEYCLIEGDFLFLLGISFFILVI